MERPKAYYRPGAGWVFPTGREPFTVGEAIHKYCLAGVQGQVMVGTGSVTRTAELLGVSEYEVILMDGGGLEVETVKAIAERNGVELVVV